MTAMSLIRLICVGLMATAVRGRSYCGNCDEKSTTRHGCSIETIEQCVCATDPYCCSTPWDELCVERVLSSCGVNCAAAGECPFEVDGNLEVLYPPLIDEDETHLDFHGSSTFMKVTILVPKQYSTAKFDFEHASSPAGGYDSTDNIQNPYWKADALSDPCNTVYTGNIPWIDFRTSLGGVKEKRFHGAVYFNTAINIEVTKNITLKPETLLLAKEGVDLMVGNHHEQEHVRYVRNKIPFEVHFDLDLNLWGQTKVRSPHLRVASAVTDSSVLNVDANANPVVSKAHLIFVTLIPLPLMLTAPTIAVDVPALQHHLTIAELVSLRNCSESQAVCTQHWIVKIAPRACSLNGQYVANMTGICHPNSQNCYAPQPNFAEIVMDITSDDYCGITQQIELQGSLVIEDTDCNTYLKGFISVNSPQGAAINHTEITQVVVSPTLKGSEFLTIYDKPTGILQYYSELINPHKVHFQFLWSGKQLRCDIIASIDVVAKVEYDATRSLQVLSVDGNSNVKTHDHKPNLLQQGQTSGQYEMRMLAHGAIRGNRIVTPDDASNVDDVRGSSGVGGVATTSTSSTGAAVTIAVIILAVVIAAICVTGGVFFFRARREKRAFNSSAAAAGVPITPRNAGFAGHEAPSHQPPPRPITHPKMKHKRTISQAVMAMRAVNGGPVSTSPIDECTPLHTPDARQQQFFHDE